MKSITRKENNMNKIKINYKESKSTIKVRRV